MRSLILPVLAAAIFAGSAAPALAGTSSSVMVSYEDLNLATPEGRQELESRIAVAVDQVCAPLPSRFSVLDRQDWAECRKFAALKAQRQAIRAIAAADTVQVASAD